MWAVNTSYSKLDPDSVTEPSTNEIILINGLDA